MKFKKLIAILSVVAIITSFSNSACASNVSEPPANTLNHAAAQEILHRYPDEISLLEETYHTSIPQINDRSLEILKAGAAANLYNSSLDFGSMMDDIALAYNEQNIESLQEVAPYGRPTEIRNFTTETLVGYSALKGEYQTRIAANSSETWEGNISLSVSGNIRGVNLTMGNSWSVSHSLHGPNGNDKLFDGTIATHNYACAVLFGSIIRNEWDLCDRSTGAVRSHHVQIVVDANTASLTPYVTRACIDSNGKIYMNSADSTKRSIGVWQNHAVFISTLKDEPIRYLEGR